MAGGIRDPQLKAPKKGKSKKQTSKKPKSTK